MKHSKEKNFTASNSSSTSVVACLCRIYKKVNCDGLSEETANELTEDIRKVSERFCISSKAAVLLAFIMENSNTCARCDKEDMANYLGCTNLEFFDFYEALRELEDRTIVSSCRNCYNATAEAIKAVEKDCDFVPVKTTGLNTDELFSRLKKIFYEFSHDNIDFVRIHDYLVNLVNQNNQLLFCRKVSESPLWSDKCTCDEHVQFFYLCHRYVTQGDQSVPIGALTELAEDDEDRQRRYFVNGKSGLQITGLVTFGNDKGFVNSDFLSLSDEVKATFFDEIELAPE